MIKPQAFLDLERALQTRLQRSFALEWAKTAPPLIALLKQRAYGLAHELIDRFTFNAGHPELARTMGIAAMALGRSRFKAQRIKPAPGVDTSILSTAVPQLMTMIEHNAVTAIRRRLHEVIEADATTVEKLAEDRSQALRVKISVQGKAYFALAASLYVSRVSSYGFLKEAQTRGVEYYQIKAVGDDRLCPVCREIDGQVFPVGAGFAHAEHVLSITDPMVLKQVAPFWSQSQAAVKLLGTLSTEQLIERGMAIPPFHPLCRCIVTPTRKSVELSPSGDTGRAGTAEAALYGEGVDYDTEDANSVLSSPGLDPALAALLGLTAGYFLTRDLFEPSPWEMPVLPLPDDEEEEDTDEEESDLP